MMKQKRYHFDIWQDGVVVAGGEGSDLDFLAREMVRYAAQYVQDGPIKITGSPELSPENLAQRTGQRG